MLQGGIEPRTSRSPVEGLGRGKKRNAAEGNRTRASSCPLVPLTTRAVCNFVLSSVLLIVFMSSILFLIYIHIYVYSIKIFDEAVSRDTPSK